MTAPGDTAGLHVVPDAPFASFPTAAESLLAALLGELDARAAHVAQVMATRPADRAEHAS